MPIYEYKCSECKKVFSKLESITNEQKVKDCPECGGKAHRIISQTSFQLKGGGWFAQGYEKKPASSCSAKKDSSPACASCQAAS
jgi:putative FmdB family regulatory protein